ncbi:MAG: LCP family protein [Clostridia bacterium]|nr:LCP family protein [Clostridia bacterium]
MSTKSFFKLLFTLIITFGLTAMSVFVAYVCTAGGSFFGYEFSSAEEKAYVNAVLLGLDKGGTRTDVIIFAQLNLVDGELNMLQIPRDTYVKNNGRSDRKINSAYGYKKQETTFKEIEMVTGLRADKYILVDTAGFRKVIDTIGGVDFEVPINMNYDDPVQDLHIHLNKGMQHLDGDKAEQFVRFRQNNDGTGYAMGDLERLQAQSKFIQATVDEVFQLANVLKINDLVEDFNEIVDTNFTLNEMLTYAPYVLGTDRDKILTHQLKGEARDMGGSYFVADTAENDKLIEEYFTPSSTTITKSELEIKTSIVGLNSKKKSAGGDKISKSVFNRFTSVDIVDASGGTANLTTIQQSLKDYGFNIRNVSSADKTVYPETLVVSKGTNTRAASVARILGLTSYMHNPEKTTGSDITIIIGEGFTD